MVPENHLQPTRFPPTSLRYTIICQSEIWMQNLVSHGDGGGAAIAGSVCSVGGGGVLEEGRGILIVTRILISDRPYDTEPSLTGDGWRQEVYSSET